MPDTLHAEILEILREGEDMTLATLRPDGWPQATAVGYASDGLAVYFGCGPQSQKAQNLAHDDRVSLTITLPYPDWNAIRGLSMSGRARRLTDFDELTRAGQLFVGKFPQVTQYVSGGDDMPAMYRVTPETISVLNYAKGFGHTDLVRVAADGRLEAI